MQFQHGDHVTCTINGMEVTDARISINKNDEPFICQNESEGGEERYCEDMLGYKLARRLHKNFEPYDNRVSNLRLFEKSWETLKEGDSIFNEKGNESKVLGVLGKLVFKSFTKGNGINWDTGYCGGYHIEELKRNGWTLTNPKEEPSDEEKAIKLLTERGRIKDGKILN